jgi:uncharacterized protein YcbK (DUF882 family)
MVHEETGGVVMGDLTAHFSKKEFACRDCGKFIKNDRLLALLEEIRTAVGQPVHVESGTRCPVRNKQVGGVADSAHLDGKAADIWVADMPQQTLGNIIKALYKAGKIPMLEYCYLIAKSKTGVHVGVDNKSRKNHFGF